MRLVTVALAFAMLAGCTTIDRESAAAGGTRSPDSPSSEQDRYLYPSW